MSVVDDVKNLIGEMKKSVSYAIDVSNKFKVLSESNLQSRSTVDCCLAATVVEKNFE